VKAVVMHEAVLKAQAKKMNVESLRSKAPTGEAMEIKITKVKKKVTFKVVNLCLPFLRLRKFDGRCFILNL